MLVFKFTIMKGFSNASQISECIKEIADQV